MTSGENLNKATTLDLDPIADFLETCPGYEYLLVPDDDVEVDVGHINQYSNYLENESRRRRSPLEGEELRFMESVKGLDDDSLQQAVKAARARIIERREE